MNSAPCTHGNKNIKDYFDINMLTLYLSKKNETLKKFSCGNDSFEIQGFWINAPM